MGSGQKGIECGQNGYPSNQSALDSKGAPPRIATSTAAVPTRGIFKIGRVYRYARPYSATSPQIDGLPNFFFHAGSSGQTLPTLERGINSTRVIPCPDGNRRMAILISSSPHKVGSNFTPWQDTFEPDLGFVRYYGDNKTGTSRPQDASGNQVLLHEFQLHTSPLRADRLRATPVLLFRRVTIADRQKGNVQFAGLAVIERAELVTQFNPSSGDYFANYLFQFAVLNLNAEQDSVDWRWFEKRRSASSRLEDVLSIAPAAWREWVRFGNEALPRLRRHVAKLSVVPTVEQQPPAGSREEKALCRIYDHYGDKKVKFEALASAVAAKILSRSGTAYREGWITPASADHGTDFVGRLTLGSGFSSAKLVVLGQAKCERPNNPTGGTHVARTVARLRRGWIGVYVTTSYFSESVQREVLEDQYPIVLVHGREVAQIATELSLESGTPDLSKYLTEIDGRYAQMISHRRPEEILFD
jgi:hypothetical protein